MWACLLVFNPDFFFLFCFLTQLESPIDRTPTHSFTWTLMSSPNPDQVSHTLLKEEVIIHPDTEEEVSTARSLPEDANYEASFEEDRSISADISIEDQTPIQPREAERIFPEDRIPEKHEEYVVISGEQVPEKPLGEEFTIISKDEIPTLDLPKTASDDDKEAKPYSGGSTSSFEEEQPLAGDIGVKPKVDDDVSISSEELPEEEIEEDISVSSVTSEEEIEDKGFEILMPDVVPKHKEDRKKQIPDDETRSKSSEKITIEDIPLTDDTVKTKKKPEIVPDVVEKDKYPAEVFEEEVVLPQEEQPEVLSKDIQEDINIPQKPYFDEDKYVGGLEEGDQAPKKPTYVEGPEEIFDDEFPKAKKPDVVEGHVEIKPDVKDDKEGTGIYVKPEKETFIVPDDELPQGVTFEAVVGVTSLEEQGGRDVDEIAIFKESLPAKPLLDREDVALEFRIPDVPGPGEDVAGYQLGEAEQISGDLLQREAALQEDLSPEDIDDEMIVYEDREQPENIGFVTHTIDYLETVPEEDSYTSSQDASFSVDDQPEGPTAEHVAATKVIQQVAIPDEDVEESLEIPAEREVHRADIPGKGLDESFEITQVQM